MRTAARIVAVTVLALAPAAWAGAPKVDVQNDSITCNTVIGTIGIKPALVLTGTATSIQLGVKGSVAGCSVSGANPANVLSGTFSGVLIMSSSNSCTALNGTTPATGTLTFKWKADPATPLLQGSSVVTVTSLTGGLFTPGAPFTSVYGEFSFATSGVTGAFTGGDSGATSSNTLVLSEDAGALGGACAGAGIKKVHIGIGTVTLQ